MGCGAVWLKTITKGTAVKQIPFAIGYHLSIMEVDAVDAALLATCGITVDSECPHWDMAHSSESEGDLVLGKDDTNDTKSDDSMDVERDDMKHAARSKQ